MWWRRKPPRPSSGDGVRRLQREERQDPCGRAQEAPLSQQAAATQMASLAD
jgi:hypothetical protein